ncbi:helix-hairpin-helix domain-containing protein [Parapedobacter tibetensis]|uniref:helix-hairpin-helix domain-containing protein n=1 Tax=Parapedobacter tibetensis TaxID=2972951 RepID=UPI00214D99BC|nr:helix-hairpin-helix domain-containing protein [Parapedobacter tibetensis]
MLKQFGKYFAFSRRELNGICVLGVFLLVLWSVPYLFQVYHANENEDISARIRDIEHFLSSTNDSISIIDKDKAIAASPNPVAHFDEITYFMFDPNGLAIVDWKRLGLSDRQIRMIKNYEAKGGRFRKNEDLKKIYAINEADYARLAPYISIKDIQVKATANDENSMGQPETQTRQYAASPHVAMMQKTLLIDLNATDSLELQQLPGIGPVYASRIVRFRDLLGGFHNVSQLMAVYGFDSVRFDGLKEYVYVDTTSVEKMALNVADYDQLKNHPLISPKLANAIVRYRQQHGHYRSLEDLLRIVIVDEEIFCKIAPYLTISND